MFIHVGKEGSILMTHTEKTMLRRKTMRTLLSHLYAFIIAGIGAYVWFTYQTAVGLIIIFTGYSWMNYPLFQMLAMIVYAIVLMVAVFWGEHLFEKELGNGRLLPRSFAVILGVEAILWIAARVIMRMYNA